MSIYGLTPFLITYATESISWTPATNGYRFIMDQSFLKSDVKIYKSAINGYKTIIDKGDGGDYLIYKITVFGLKTNDWDDLFNKIKHKVIVFRPFGDSTFYFNAIVTTCKPFFHNSSFYKDAVQLVIESQEYETLIEKYVP